MLKSSLDSKNDYFKREKLSVREFSKLYDQKVKDIGIDIDLTKRSLNFGFSGGEKKRNEILQMAVLEPDLAILDETDSGLDIDALKLVSEGVNELRSENKSMLIITHYQRLLNYIQPDHVHVLAHGKIQRSGGKELALELEAKGYAEFSGEAA
jgi:Fe-S cluster assembly ATP-binding protein